MVRKDRNWLEMDHEEFAAYADEQERPLIEELAKIDRAQAEAVERKRAIRDERLKIDEMRRAHAEANRSPNAGPDQSINNNPH